MSPSLWNPHAPAYATAPYPSPPTAAQVQVPQPPYADPTADCWFIAGPASPAIYAAPPQFLQDPTIINYSGAAPPFPPPYHAHPQGFQGYAQVTPAPSPEVYHGGVTYYSTQNQIQRPPMMAPQKRPKSVLQLVEPPEKAKGMKEPPHQPQQQQQQPPPHQQEQEPVSNTIPENVEAELVQKMQETTLESSDRKPTPQFTETSWADEMEEMAAHSESYEGGNHVGVTDSKEKPEQGSKDDDSSAKEKATEKAVD